MLSNSQFPASESSTSNQQLIFPSSNKVFRITFIRYGSIVFSRTSNFSSSVAILVEDTFSIAPTPHLSNTFIRDKYERYCNGKTTSNFIIGLIPWFQTNVALSSSPNDLYAMHLFSGCGVRILWRMTQISLHLTTNDPIILLTFQAFVLDVRLWNSLINLTAPTQIYSYFDRNIIKTILQKHIKRWPLFNKLNG